MLVVVFLAEIGISMQVLVALGIIMILTILQMLMDPYRCDTVMYRCDIVMIAV